MGYKVRNYELQIRRKIIKVINTHNIQSRYLKMCLNFPMIFTGLKILFEKMLKH